MTERYQSTNKFTGEKVYKFKDYLYYDDIMHMSEEDKHKEILKDKKILNFINSEYNKNKIYKWNSHWGFCEDTYIYTSYEDLCQCIDYIFGRNDICRKCKKRYIEFDN